METCDFLGIFGKISKEVLILIYIQVESILLVKHFVIGKIRILEIRLFYPHGTHCIVWVGRFYIGHFYLFHIATF